MTTVVVRPNSTLGVDTYIHEGNPTFNYGVTTTMQVGTALGGTNNCRGLIKFDLSFIPVGATVTSAIVSLYCSTEAALTDEDVAIHRALTDWYEGNVDGAAVVDETISSTWRYRNDPSATVWVGGAGGGSGSDYAASATDTTTISAPTAFYDWDVTTDVIIFQSGSAVNRGWWLINTDEVSNSTSKTFVTSDGATEEQTPYITVVYTVAASPAAAETCHAKLKITDGSTSVDLLYGPVYLSGWRGETPEIKDGGSWRSSPLTDGRRLAFRRLSNIIDTFDLKIRGHEPDAAISAFNSLEKLLEKAVGYWHETSNDPVYIEARASGETYTRYAIIMDGRLPEYENLYAQPFLQANKAAVMDELSMIIEHGHWLEYPPGLYAAKELSVVSEFDDRNLGNVDEEGVREPTSGAHDVYVSNYSTIGNITDIYTESGGTWSANLMGAAFPFDITGAAVNDATYYGIDTSLENATPFYGLIFDIAQVAVSNGTGHTFTWEYYDDTGSWASIQFDFDHTDNFSRTGVNSVLWFADMGTNPWDTINLLTLLGGSAPNVTGWWVRCRLSALNGVMTNTATQQNRDIYAPTKPFVEIQSADVAGTLPALARINLEPMTSQYISTFMVGSRAVSRGADFNAYINLSDIGNDSWISITKPTLSSFVDRWEAPTGRCLSFVSDDGYRFGFAILGVDYVSQYVGRYRVFLRAALQNDPGDMRMRLIRLDNYDINGSPLYKPISDWVYNLDANTTNQAYHTYDFGELVIPDGLSDWGAYYVGVEIDEVNTLTGTDYFYDFVLVPVDEMAISLFGDDGAYTAQSANTSNIHSGQYFDLDGVTSPRRPIQGFTRNLQSNAGRVIVPIDAPSGIVVPGSERTRLWWFWRYYNDGTTQTGIPQQSVSRLYASTRFHGPRGGE